MAIFAYGLTLLAGWLRWSSWLAIPLGFLLFFIERRANPHLTDRINRVGLPLYCGGAFVIMKVIGWAHGLIE